MCVPYAWDCPARCRCRTRAVEFAVFAAQAMNCQVRETSIFARKNYFYPDLPKGYQISQFDKPLAEHGWIEMPAIKRRRGRSASRGCTWKRMRARAFMTGWSIPMFTSIDLNRSGTPLVEIVSEPDMRSADEAFEYLTLLKEIILYTGVSDCNMEEGSLRCDANVSVRPRPGKVRDQGGNQNVNS